MRIIGQRKMIERGEERKGREQEKGAMPSFHGTEDKHLSAADNQILAGEKKNFFKNAFIIQLCNKKVIILYGNKVQQNELRILKINSEGNIRRKVFYDQSSV